MDNLETKKQQAAASRQAPKAGNHETSSRSAAGAESTPVVANPPLHASAADRELFPIRTVSSLTGVNSITLRAWERRYGLVRPLRTPSGHRLYRREEIDLIHRVVALLDKGIAISQVQRALGRPEPAHDAPDAGNNAQWAGPRRRMLSAVMRFDEDALEGIYHEMLGVASAHEITQHLLAPLLEELGQRRRSAEGGRAEELFFSVYLRHRLGARFQHRPRGTHGPLLLGACLPGEHRDVELLLFALTVQEIGLRWLLLGPDVPLDALTGVVAQRECGAIVLDGSSDPAAGVLTGELHRLTTAVSIPVFVRGAVSIHRRDQIVTAGAVPIGSDIAAGAKRLANSLRITESQPS